MDLYIETLTGTAFELRVSPFETVMNVKAKIQRLEGIPIAHQHLIWRSVELEDDYCLHDYDINDGATLQLVLAMRGGPINMKRVPVEDNALREMAEYVEANRDEIWDRLPKDNRHVTFLLFRDGENVNVYRVVDRGDGTLTPLSDALSGTSYNYLYDDDDEDNTVSVPQETIQENNVTMNKMKLLRSKMQSLHMSKKTRGATAGGGTSVEQVSFQPHSPPARILYQPRPPSKEKHPIFQPRPPSVEKPSSSSMTTARRRFHRASHSRHGQEEAATLHFQDKNGYSNQVEKSLPPINKTKNSNNIDISEFVNKNQEEPPVPGFNPRTIHKHFDHNDRTVSNPLLSGHKPLPGVGQTGDNDLQNGEASYNNKAHSNTSASRRITPLREKKTSLERLRSGFLNDSLTKVHRTQQSSGGSVYSASGSPKKSRPLQPPQLVSGKKNRCTFCRKKTGLATTYVCRCGESFCATHRYAETHNCNFDYKTEGRKLLEQSNPLVVAPKLPKI